MNTYYIEHVNGSRVPFKILASDEDEALEKVFEHMGSTDYVIVETV